MFDVQRYSSLQQRHTWTESGRIEYNSPSNKIKGEWEQLYLYLTHRLQLKLRRYKKVYKFIKETVSQQDLKYSQKKKNTKINSSKC